MTIKVPCNVSSCKEQHHKQSKTSVKNNTMSSTANLKRMRSMLIITTLPLVSSMVVTTPNTNANSQTRIKPSITMKKIEELRKNSIHRENVVRRGLFGDASAMKGQFLDLFDDIQKDDDDDDKEEVSMSFLVSSQNITGFQAATGSEVLNIELHLQIEAARRRREADAAFIESHVQDASPAEKLAMKMIPMQLPYPATKLSEPNLKNLKFKKQHDRSKTTTTPTTTKLLSHEKEIELANLIRQGAQLQSIKTEFEVINSRPITRAEWTQLAGLDSPSTLRRLISSYRQAKSQLVTANMGLVYAVVRQQQQLHKSSTLSEEELIQEGSLGLIRAAELFDPERGLRFSTYATIWIKGVLGNAKIDQLIKIPDREQRKWNKINKLLKERAEWYGVRFGDVILEGQGDGHDNDHDNNNKSNDLSDLIINEVALLTGMTPETIVTLRRKMAQSRHIMSLDYKYQSQSRSGTPKDNSDNNAESQLIYNNDGAFLSDESLSEMLQLRADVVAALAKNLDPREARLMRLRYGLTDGTPRTMRECAEAMGLSRQRVQQLASNCLKKLRTADDAESLQEYLLTVA